MTAPVWLSGVFVALMLAVAGFCAGRMVVARQTGRPAELDSDITHVLMGVAMAGMLASAVRIGTPAMWIVLSGGGATWFGWQALGGRRGASSSAWRCSQPIPHLLECVAMLYMILAARAVHAARPSTGASAGMAMGTGAARLSIVSLVLAGFMIGYVVLLADRLTLATNTNTNTNTIASVTCAPALASRCGTMCKMAMGMTMAYMLVLML
ncbi:MAG: DUF5134 domain-containing protein [Streptosporangiaceae bacterium]|nr:DUF5134 domain-containing protein [Streptosporangiaceae bacterium]